MGDFLFRQRDPDAGTLDEGLLSLLLKDRTTGKNIIWATKSYRDFGEGYGEKQPIRPELISGGRSFLIQPRHRKEKRTQAARTKKMAEVFTPLWICKDMRDRCDRDFFGQNTRGLPPEKLPFDDDKTPLKYIDRRFLEITCGEAPYIVTRYDPYTGKTVPPEDRAGVLDRKLRVVNRHAPRDMWLSWTLRAFQSVYGYEWQGDSLLIARLNLLFTFIEGYKARFGIEPPRGEVKKIANVITWNFWQMDGLSGRVPAGGENSGEGFYRDTLFTQTSLFAGEEEEREEAPPLCLVRDWRSKKTLKFSELSK